MKDIASFESKSGFNIDTAPYILATDFPFLVWHKFNWQDKKVLIIADSGDNIITLFPLGVKEIYAVDIAKKACFINELKRVAIQHLCFTEFKTLFAPAYENPFFPLVNLTKKKNIYARLRSHLSPEARNWLDKNIGNNHFPSPNWREVTFAHLIPHFIDEKSFLKAQKAIKPYLLFNLPIEIALEEFQEKFDVIYLSNIPEYIKQNLRLEDKEAEIESILLNLYAKALRRLSPNGYLILYYFGDAKTQSDLITHEINISKQLNLKLQLISFSFSTPLIKNSHFTHTLVVFRNN